MERIAERVHQAAQTDVTVLVIGESGTGKERIAQALHTLGPRSRDPFVATSCAAIPAALMESQLFGHVRGAFTGARREHRGLFSQAHRGTLLLDEIDSMPLELQPKLLRALEDRVVRPLGSDHEIPFNARIVAASSRDLRDVAAEGAFREDLLFRLDVLRIQLPPLRERTDEIVGIAEGILRALSQQPEPVHVLSDGAAEALQRHDWPGNVRELRNCMEHAVAVARHRRIHREDLPARIRDAALKPRDPTRDTGQMPTLERVEAAYVREVLQRVGGNKLKAARLLGLSRATLYRKLRT